MTAGLQEALGDRYQIEREIGRGGMATVYLAEDRKHERMVALKVLHPELAVALGPKRFRREIAIAAQLQHPHILPLLDSGEAAGGPLWFAMPYVEGESLRDRITREHQLPLAVALRITREVAAALEYAHHRGVIHRDVKPENILLSGDGHTLLADFGVARDVINVAGPRSERRITDTGLSIGTLEYMSPEQTAGQPDVDARTDVYSLGCVLYEMLAGEPPFTGATPQALVARRLVERPLPLRAVRDRIPDTVERAVDIALARVPADRFSSAREFAEALEGAGSDPEERSSANRPSVRGQGDGDRRPRRRWANVASRGWGVAAGVVVGLGLFFAWTRWKTAPVAAEPVRVAVLPFDAAGDTANRYLSDGVVDAIRGKLAGLTGLQVIGRASSVQYRGTQKSPPVVARELGAGYLLTGHIRAEKLTDGTMRVHVQPQLVHVGEDSAVTIVWQDTDTSVSDLFQQEAGIAAKVAKALGVTVTPSEQEQLAGQPTRNLAAYDAFLQAEARQSSSPASLHQRATYYGEAVALDSTFGPAWAGLALAHAGLYYATTPTVTEATAAADALSRAQALMPGRPETQVALAVYELGVHRDATRARLAAEGGLATAPNNVPLLYWAASTERSSGQWALALDHVRRAELLDPHSARVASDVGVTNMYLRRYREAAAAFDRALTLDPGAIGLYEFRTLVNLGQGDSVGGQAVIRRALLHIDTAEVVAFYGSENDMYWILDGALQRRLLSLGPEAFDGDLATWGAVRAETYWLHGDTAHARVYADSARREFASQLRTAPDDDLLHLMHGLMLAYLGQKSEAIKEGQRGLAATVARANAVSSLYPEQVLARIYTEVGEPDKAMDQLEALVRVPSFLSPARLRIDPMWARLHGNPRFERLTARHH